MIAFFVPKILIEKNIKGIPIINIIADTDKPLTLLKTTDKPLRPPGAIVCGLKNIFNATLIKIQPTIIPIDSFIKFLKFIFI